MFRSRAAATMPTTGMPMSRAITPMVNPAQTMTRKPTSATRMPLGRCLVQTGRNDDTNASPTAPSIAATVRNACDQW
ncbi:hypothetical protein [Actinoplanes couchii]|uniref:hypothetical protein n=1 Tax=Actinoplanes couchii TaxID=403638 RepID=UPI001943D92C|nr:hypothetical protein [Actinoplanes couchii]